MRSISSTWFETKVKYDKTMENGLLKSVREAYAVEALSFTEAEAAITAEMSKYISGEYNIVEEKIASYREVLFSDDETADKFYKVKMELITIDEKSDKEKRQVIYYLVQADSVESARQAMRDSFMGSMLDNEIVSVSKTNILDVFTHKLSHDIASGKVSVSVETSEGK